MYLKGFSRFRKLFSECLQDADINAAIFILVILALVIGLLDLVEWVCGTVE